MSVIIAAMVTLHHSSCHGRKISSNFLWPLVTHNKKKNCFCTKLDVSAAAKVWFYIRVNYEFMLFIQISEIAQKLKFSCVHT